MDSMSNNKNSGDFPRDNIRDESDVSDDESDVSGGSLPDDIRGGNEESGGDARNKISETMAEPYNRNGSRVSDGEVRRCDDAAPQDIKASAELKSKDSQNGLLRDLYGVKCLKRLPCPDRALGDLPTSSHELQDGKKDISPTSEDVELLNEAGDPQTASPVAVAIASSHVNTGVQKRSLDEATNVNTERVKKREECPSQFPSGMSSDTREEPVDVDHHKFKEEVSSATENDRVAQEADTNEDSRQYPEQDNAAPKDHVTTSDGRVAGSPANAENVEGREGDECLPSGQRETVDEEVRRHMRNLNNEQENILPAGGGNLTFGGVTGNGIGITNLKDLISKECRKLTQLELLNDFFRRMSDGSTMKAFLSPPSTAGEKRNACPPKGYRDDHLPLPVSMLLKGGSGINNLTDIVNIYNVGRLQPVPISVPEIEQPDLDQQQPADDVEVLQQNGVENPPPNLAPGHGIHIIVEVDPDGIQEICLGCGAVVYGDHLCPEQQQHAVVEEPPPPPQNQDRAFNDQF